MGSAQAFRAFADRVFGIGTLALYAWSGLTVRRWLYKDKHFEPCAGLERQSGIAAGLDTLCDGGLCDGGFQLPASTLYATVGYVTVDSSLLHLLFLN